MAQVINPQIREDDTARNIANGLQIYAFATGKPKDDQSAASMTSSTALNDYSEAMRRRFEALQRQGNPDGTGN